MFLILLLIAYGLGSLSSAIILCRALGKSDPRQAGSGNPGTTNVLRLEGKKLALLVLAGDVLKGLVPILLAKLLGIQGGGLAWLGLVAVIGHIYPVFFNFKGGKGVATALGAIMALAWPLALMLSLIWLVMVGWFRYSSLASLTAAVAAPILAYAFYGHFGFPILLMSTLLVVRHRRNIQRLLNGTEPKIGHGKS